MFKVPIGSSEVTTLISTTELHMVFFQIEAAPDDVLGTNECTVDGRYVVKFKEDPKVDTLENSGKRALVCLRQLENGSRRILSYIKDITRRCRSRKFQNAIIHGVEKMLRIGNIQPCHRGFQLELHRPTRDKLIQEYVLPPVSFGEAQAGSLRLEHCYN